MGLLFSRRRVPSCRKHASHMGKRRLRLPCVRCLAPLGQGALPVCVFDAVCPAGQKRFRVGAPDFGRSTGKSFLRGVLPIRKLSRRAGERETEPSYIFQRGGDVCRLTGGTRPSPGKIFHIILPPQTRHSTRRASSSARFAANEGRRPRLSFRPPRRASFPRPSRRENGGLCPHPLKGPNP